MTIKMSHGGDVHEASRLLKKPISAIFDFSASINPLGPSRRALRALQRSTGLIGHYPDPKCTSLVRALASHLRMPADNIVVANGSTELIHLIPRALKIRHALIVGPTFSEYATALRLAGGRCTALLASRRDDYRPPIERIAPKIRAASARQVPVDAVFLCHPNSPTGQVCDPRELASAVKVLGRAGLWVILDETFIEYAGVPSMGAILRRCPRLIILRSFTKFYALPGLRIGYALASRPVSQRLREFVPTWSVGTAAQLAAQAALMDADHAARSLRKMERERVRFTSMLMRLPGLRLFPSRCNFLLLEFPSQRLKTSVLRRLRSRGLLVRDCAGIRGLTASAVRVAIKTAPQNDRLVRALRSLLL